jgi:uncharacterized protein (DUF849 family)
MSLAAGGGVRVGLEDGMHLDSGKTTLAKNIDLVERVHQMGNLLSLEVASPAQFKSEVLQ